MNIIFIKKNFYSDSVDYLPTGLFDINCTLYRKRHSSYFVEFWSPRLLELSVIVADCEQIMVVLHLSSLLSTVREGKQRTRSHKSRSALIDSKLCIQALLIKSKQSEKDSRHASLSTRQLVLIDLCKINADNPK
uniref:Uncharacterized protein n=1 Tax=Glossina pallidipes TaxID=7398 RepID=A0A1A9ZIX6_GLOPL